MAEYSRADEDRVEDLDVSPEDADDVSGGSLNFTRQGGVPQTSLKITDINSSSLESFSRDA